MLTSLLDQLKNPVPNTRIEALCAFVMLEETEALDLLGQMWKSETHPEVRQALAWAGKQIQNARQRGYSTSAAMAQVFRLDRTPPDEEDLEEKRLLSQIQSSANLERTKQHGSDEDKHIGQIAKNAATAAGLSMALGLGAGAALGMMGSAVGASSNLSDGSGDNRPRVGQGPIVPPRPASAEIGAWLKRLADADPKSRMAAILQLRDFNNPAALGPLGTRFVTDADQAIRQAAQQTGKLIYFSALYWQERDKRAMAKAGRSDSMDSDVSAILARAEANKQKRATRH
jgi:hypothetical protein